MLRRIGLFALWFGVSGCYMPVGVQNGICSGSMIGVIAGMQSNTRPDGERAYYYDLRERVFQQALHLYDYKDDGEVAVKLLIRRDGKLLASVVDQEHTQASEWLVLITERAVQKAAPFRPFPAPMRKNETITSTVVVRYQHNGEHE